MFKEADKKTSRVVSPVDVPSSGFFVLSFRPAFWRYFLQFCLVSTVASAGCGCTFRGPVTGLNYDVDYYSYGVELQTDFLKLTIGTQNNDKENEQHQKKSK